MGKYFYIEEHDITVNVSYLLDSYIIGLQIGKIYTILHDRFKTEKEAILYLTENFGWLEEIE